MSHRNTGHMQMGSSENSLLSKDEFTIALGLYIDDSEVANPLGTSKLKHKMCAIYWGYCEHTSKI